MKLAHLMPAGFVLFLIVGTGASLFIPSVSKIFPSTISIYLGILLFHATGQNKSLKIGLLSVVASVLQLTGYGLGFLSNAIEVFLLGKKDGMDLGASK